MSASLRVGFVEWVKGKSWRPTELIRKRGGEKIYIQPFDHRHRYRYPASCSGFRLVQNMLYCIRWKLVHWKQILFSLAGRNVFVRNGFCKAPCGPRVGMGVLRWIRCKWAGRLRPRHVDVIRNKPLGRYISR